MFWLKHSFVDQQVVCARLWTVKDKIVEVATVTATCAGNSLWKFVKNIDRYRKKIILFNEIFFSIAARSIVMIQRTHFGVTAG